MDGNGQGDDDNDNFTKILKNLVKSPRLEGSKDIRDWSHRALKTAKNGLTWMRMAKVTKIMTMRTSAILPEFFKILS